MPNDDRSGLAGSWSIEWKPNEPRSLGQLRLDNSIVTGAEMLLGHIQGAKSQTALNVAKARAEGFVFGVESAGITSTEVAAMQQIFDAACSHRRSQVEAE